MSSIKEVRSKISSVKSTQKITKAMELVAASKMRKAQDRMSASKPYAKKMLEVISHLASANPEYSHTFMEARTEIKRVAYIIVSSDRGLCGGLNINLFKKVILDMKQNNAQGIDSTVCLIGSKAKSFFKGQGFDIAASVSGLGDQPTADKLIGSVQVVLDAFVKGEVDQVKVVYNDFVNTMTQSPTIQNLLPLSVDSSTSESKYSWDYLYEPTPEYVLNALLNRYIESQVYQSVVENIASEQAARMVAMKAATDNAGDLINDLELVYNKARQAAITQELSEIVSGAAAV